MNLKKVTSKETFQKNFKNTKIYDILLSSTYEVFLEYALERATFEEYSVLEFPYFSISLLEKACELDLNVELQNDKWLVSKK
ncbi:hypothetical protein NRIC_00390 [Enterococcus florum]|uniref:Uncharacterized protein n=1 Tax=Enterococcus florum TaxID=2480627 RepID=A0A4P5P888_9ENTE|nr:hypothetical protein [Enterococcus florum]GCF92148.1 hypothetical protein NRIC_00390 [Enterococcus florum]